MSLSFEGLFACFHLPFTVEASAAERLRLPPPGWACSSSKPCRYQISYSILSCQERSWFSLKVSVTHSYLTARIRPLHGEPIASFGSERRILLVSWQGHYCFGYPGCSSPTRPLDCFSVSLNYSCFETFAVNSHSSSLLVYCWIPADQCSMISYYCRW